MNDLEFFLEFKSEIIFCDIRIKFDEFENEYVNLEISIEFLGMKKGLEY